MIKRYSSLAGGEYFWGYTINPGIYDRIGGLLIWEEIDS
jgi:hypothetical protein